MREQPAEPECQKPEGCAHVVPCNPGCAVTAQALHDAMAKRQSAEFEQDYDRKGAEMWAAIRDHAANDADWWRQVTRIQGGQR